MAWRLTSSKSSSKRGLVWMCELYYGLVDMCRVRRDSRLADHAAAIQRQNYTTNPFGHLAFWASRIAHIQWATTAAAAVSAIWALPAAHTRVATTRSTSHGHTRHGRHGHEKLHTANCLIHINRPNTFASSETRGRGGIWRKANILRIVCVHICMYVYAMRVGSICLC